MDRFNNVRLWIAVMLCLAGVLAAGAAQAQMDIPEEMRTVFMIGDIESGILGIYPLVVYLVNGNQLIQGEEWSAWEEGIGPVGLAVDEVHERLFVSYESHDEIDVFNARNMDSLGSIPLSGTSDLAGIEVHNDTNRLLVIDRWVGQVWEFDTNNFSHLDTWTMDTCQFPLGIDTVGDVLWASCGVEEEIPNPYPPPETIMSYAPSNLICSYDLNTQQELQCVTTTRAAAGLAVTDYPELTLYYTGWYEHDYAVKHVVATGVAQEYDLEDFGKGISLNPATGLVYVAEGEGAPFHYASLRVLNANGMSQLHRYDRPNGFLNYPSPTDVIASTIPFGGTVSKECTSHAGGIADAGDEIVFTITIENRHTKAISSLPMRDSYDTEKLTYLYSSPASDDNTNDGQVDWDDLTTSIGQNLAVGASTTVEVHFLAEPDPCEVQVEGLNIAQMAGAEDTSGTVLPDAAGMAEYTIICGCQVNTDCDDGVFCNGEEICGDDGKCEAATTLPCQDDGLYCNGVESCDEDSDQCDSTGDPCVDDNVFCNGVESCNERDDSCDSSGNPCPDDSQFCNGEEVCNEETDGCDTQNLPDCADDGLFCNGSELCDEAADECKSTGDPCSDDGQFCNGEESCDEETDACVSSGDPCEENEYCNEDTDTCLTEPQVDDDDDDAVGEDEDQWPEGKVSGGCCGCD